MTWISIVSDASFWILFVIAVERITEIVHAGEIFSPIRKRISEIAFPPNQDPPPEVLTFFQKFFVFLHKLITCGFCTSTWIALFMTPFVPGDVFFIAKWFALMGLSNFWHDMSEILTRGRIHAYDFNVSVNVKREDQGESEESP